jgi:hypothetical protein
VVIRKSELKFLSRAYEEINARSTFTDISCKYVYITRVTWYKLHCVILEMEWGGSSDDLDSTPSVC